MEEGVVPRLRRPRALVVLPSRDLASQVLVSTPVITCFSITHHGYFYVTSTILRQWKSPCVMLPDSELLDSSEVEKRSDTLSKLGWS